MLPTENINSFFEQKQHQQYYDQSYYPHDNSNGQHLLTGPPPPSHPSFNNGDNCDSYGFQQHYEQNQMHSSSIGPHHHHHHPNFVSSNQIHGSIGSSHLQGINSQNSQHYFGNFEIPHGTSISASSHFENSNSSSDFNFLSNIANDFSQAPEYYQLS